MGFFVHEETSYFPWFPDKAGSSPDFSPIICCDGG